MDSNPMESFFNFQKVMLFSPEENSLGLVQQSRQITSQYQGFTV
jgi:hypothetical protein